jgi:energy-coupling factor transporter ATP-binding protein EcfA2
VSVPTLHFTRIVIDRLDGLEPSGFALEDLEPGINIVYGPNASGKTSLSGAIRQLLAPHERAERFRRSVLHASLQLDVEAVLLDFDMGDVRVQRGTNGQPLPPLVPEGIRDRYIFALHDLLQGDASDLAGDLLKQSAGGFDLRSARDELGFRNQVSTRRAGAYQNLLAARKRVEIIRTEQERLIEDERRLADLQSEYSRTREATDRARLLEKADAWLEARRAVGDRADDLARFPAGMDKLCGDEAERLRQLRTKLTAALGAKQRNASAQQSAAERLEGAAFGPNPPDDQLIGVLRQKCQRVRTLAATLEERKAKLAAAARVVQQTRNVLGSRAPNPQDPLLEAEKVDRLLAFARQGEPLRSKVDAANELERWLAGLEKGSAAAGPDELDRAAQLLGRWLAAHEAAKTLSRAGAESRQRTAALGAAIAWGALALILALTVHLSWLFALVVSGGLVLWALWPRRADSAIDPRPSLESEFAKLAVRPPAVWSAETIETRLRELQKEACEAAFEQVRAARWSDFKPRMLECRQHLETYRADLLQHLRDADLTDDILGSGEGGLVVLATNILRCQDAYAGWEALQAEVAHLQDQCRDQLSEISRTLAPCGYVTADVETAATQVEDLARRLAQRDASISELKTCEKESQRLATEETTAQAQLASFFETAGIAPDDDAELYRRLEQLPRYQQADEALKRARRDVELKARDLGDAAPFENVAADTLAAELAECRERADRAEGVHKEIIEIQTLIQKAKQKSDLEEALAGHAKAQGDLGAQREADCDAITGDLLCDLLDEQQRDLQQPAVLERARHLFGRITHGRYRLEVSRAGEGEPAFRAVETARSRVLPLDQLSGGTRLQLLFAVRLAFLEMQESQWKLPLVLDETLGNSDEARAEQIIDAAIEICRQGRQVFYLTAQHDEVSKWRRRLKGCADIRWKHVDLAEVRNFSAVERVPVVDYEALPAIEVVRPDGDDWLGYGKRLRVPMPDAYSKPEELHLWYMVDEVQLLYRLLKQGINLWGQLRELVSLNSLPADCVDFKTGSAAFLRAEARADLLETVFRYWRLGRGKPVDRAVLEASGAIGERFLPEVSQLAKEVAGDARLLLAALAEGRVPRFQQRNREKLQHYLAEHDYLDENESLALDVVKQRARIEAFAVMERGLIDPFTIDVLIDLVYGISTNSVGYASHGILSGP